MRKVIFTVDLDAFFASCEEILDPTLASKPVAVGYELGGRGIVTTANYIARKKGVKTAMPLYKARRLCPDLVVVPPKFEHYNEMSEQVFQILKSFATKIEVASIDEAHLDVTKSLMEGESPIELATKIQRFVKMKTGLGVSIGISDVKVLAKIASGLKKPLGITTLFSYDIESKLWPLPINELYGVGTATDNFFKSYKIETIGDLATLKRDSNLFIQLENKMGKRFEFLYQSANGIASDEVVESDHQLKSIGAQETYPRNLSTYEQVEKELLALTKRICERAKYRNLIGNVVSFNIQGEKSTQMYKTKSFKIDKYSNDVGYIFPQIMKLFDSWWDNREIRFLGVSLGNLINAFYYQGSQPTIDDFLIPNNKEKSEHDKQIEDSLSIISDINMYMGFQALTNADDLENNKKYNDKKLSNNDRVKFKVWGDKADTKKQRK